MSHAEYQPTGVAVRPAGSRTAPAPTAAERARTLLEFASSVVLDVPGVDLTARPGIPPLVDCAPLPDGALAVLVETASPLHRIAATARSAALPAELEAVDVAPVAVPYRIRGRAHAHGRLAPLPPADPALLDALFPRRSPAGRSLLRLELDHLAVDDLWGSDCCLDLAAFAAADPDPVAAEEAGLLQHLAAAHADQLRALGAEALEHRSGLRSWGGPASTLTAVRPIALDRYGLRVRLLGTAQGQLLDARFEFHRPVGSPDELPEAMHRLFAHVRH